ncbi:hypothetical protein BD324DRAFT_655201 [Kockovaella imperatae]|uniref:Carrier domain-containing protein n=1 Tax=Kockovaella imperatae TaxID=4999 RepID=A0A1Y1UQH2_9TREE|nr:hypothetical protein BD324DRAFT_655201 [Kockovaella imperatae]ORX40318.1 hypothetical protein BD324DRAFT_655201 [Kockovaella imperatae]
MTLSYLVSTAGYSREQNESYPHDITSIVQLIDEGANEFEDEPVVGFARLTDPGWVCDRYSYRYISRLADGLTTALEMKPVSDNPTIGLLCPSNLDFLVAWIALMRLGYGVLFVAPQCSPSAIASLLESTKSDHLLYHSKYQQLAEQVESPARVTLLPSPTAPRPCSRLPSYNHLTSHIFHSSGTSGNPKPIPHKHHVSTASLPRRALPDEPHGPPPEPAAFTTTPLFHGGVSDLLRAWMARSVLYLYPTSEVPITSRNVCLAVEACNRGVETSRYRVNSFLSVPYILSTLADDSSGVDLLKQMDLVSTGGAPLEKETGDKMVRQGIRLVSRLGSSECGFLLSSYRDFEHDLEWDWLRNNSAYSQALSFEPSPIRDGLFELVVGNEWLSKTKSNRPDDSYATGDLYRPHPSKPDVWQYAGRGDDVIVMSNGEKATPGFVEERLRRSKLIAEAIVVGSNRPSLGLLVFTDAPKDRVIAELQPILNEVNREQPSYAAIHPDACLLLSGVAALDRIPRASKGTIQRGLVDQVFAQEITSIWRDESDEEAQRTREEIQEFCRDAVGQMLGSPVDIHTDLFNSGIDSLKATRLRSQMIKFVGGKPSIPLNVVFEQSTIASLAEYMYSVQQGTSVSLYEFNEHTRMLEWADKYGSFSQSQGPKAGLSRVLVLTGATGSLGREVLNALSDSAFDRIICLVRGENDDDARVRVQKAVGSDNDLDSVSVHVANLASSDLGLDAAVLDALTDSEVSVIHAAWPVHFGSSLQSFEDSIKGLHNLLSLYLRCGSPNRFIFCSSLASVLRSDQKSISETPSTDPSTATPIGYSRSKWIAEQICAKARDVHSSIVVARLGQLCGNSKTGVWNETEGWPLLLRTADTTRSLPLLDDVVNWLPVDVAARVLLDLVHEEQPDLIYHLVHPSPTTWSTVLDGVESSGTSFERLPRSEWLERVEQIPDEDISRKMLFLWRQSYGEDSPSSVSYDIATTNAQKASSSLRQLRALQPRDFARSIEAWRNTGFMT